MDGKGLRGMAAAGLLVCLGSSASLMAAEDSTKVRPDPAKLDPSRGLEVGATFEAWMSPWQEGGEEADTPKTVPKTFQSTAPSKDRAQREAEGHRGHGVIRFSKDLSRAWVDVKVEGVEAKEVNMFHIHCGNPGILGPILVDFSTMTSLQDDLKDGVISVEVTNKVITSTVEHAHGLVGVMTAGCLMPGVSLEGPAPVKVSTVGGMYTLATQGQLYFNLHTVGQTYYGDMRGQVWPASK